MTVGGESFLIYTGNVEGTAIDQMDKENKNKETLMMVFISPMGREILRSAFIWFGDGTFKTCPLPFAQIYTVFGMRKGYNSLPAVFSLLPNKTEATYRQMWEVIKKEIGDEYIPQFLMIDI